MGLYLCVLDDKKNDIDGVEVGSYDDFDYFRSTVVVDVEKGDAGSICPTLILHSDSDGIWSVDDVTKLIQELSNISNIFKKKPIKEFNSEWQKELAEEIDLKPQNLFECFIDVDGEFLINRLQELCETSLNVEHPIYFQ